jgi:hypothetical protein
MKEIMTTLLLFFRGWLGLYFLVIHFVVPFYLVAIYPEVPAPAVSFLRGFGYGVISGPPSDLGFWYRFLSCGAWVLVGVLLLWRRIYDFSAEQTVREERRARRKKKRDA